MDDVLQAALAGDDEAGEDFTYESASEASILKVKKKKFTGKMCKRNVL